MKTWNQPNLEELSMKATAYGSITSEKTDGTYTSNDGKYVISTYGTSGKTEESR